MGRRLLPALVPTTAKEGVPKVYHEPHVETGFRQLGQPWSYYLCSLFQVHNECMNSWTHLLAFVAVLHRAWTLSEEFDMVHDPYMWPLATGLLTNMLLYLCSAGAHCFSNKSELVHYTCFIVDYAGIGINGLGCGIVHYWYCMHEDMAGTVPHRFAAPVGVAMCALVCTGCSISKTFYSRPYPPARRQWQMVSCFLMYCWLISPVWYQLYMSVFFSHWKPSLSHHLQQMVWFTATAFFLGSDIPQRFMPGRCDFIGHSHQLFHLCIMMMSLKHFDAVYLDIITDKAALHADRAPTFLNTFGAVLVAIFVNICIILVFREIARRKIAKEAADKALKTE